MYQTKIKNEKKSVATRKRVKASDMQIGDVGIIVSDYYRGNTVLRHAVGWTALESIESEKAFSPTAPAVDVELYAVGETITLTQRAK